MAPRWSCRLASAPCHSRLTIWSTTKGSVDAGATNCRVGSSVSMPYWWKTLVKGGFELPVFVLPRRSPHNRWSHSEYSRMRSEEHTSELQSHSDLHSFPTRRSSDLLLVENIG